MYRIYCSVLWETWFTLNFIENKIAARKITTKRRRGSKQNNFFKQLSNFIISSAYKTRNISQYCNFQKEFFGILLIEPWDIFVHFQIIVRTKIFFIWTMSDLQPLRKTGICTFVRLQAFLAIFLSNL